MDQHRHVAASAALLAPAPLPALPFRFVHRIYDHENPDGLVLPEELRQEFLATDKDTCIVRVRGGPVHLMHFECLPGCAPMFVKNWIGFSRMYSLHAAEKLRFIYNGGLSFVIEPYSNLSVETRAFPSYIRNHDPPRRRKIHGSRQVYLLGNFQFELGWSKDCPEYKYLPPLCFFTSFGLRTWEIRRQNMTWMVQLERLNDEWLFSTGFKDFILANKFEKGTVLDFDGFEQEDGRAYMKVSQW